MKCKNCESTNTRLFDDSGYAYYNIYVCDTCGDSFKVDREVIPFDTNTIPSEIVLRDINKYLDKENCTKYKPLNEIVNAHFGKDYISIEHESPRLKGGIPTTYNNSIREQFFNNLLSEQISKEELERMIENSYARKHHLIFKKAVDKCREVLNELDNQIIEDIKKEQQMKQTPETFIGLSDGIPDCYVSTEEDDGIKFLTMQEDCNTTTLKLDKEAIEHLKLIIEWAE